MDPDSQPNGELREIYHRLRNPLAGIRTTAQVLQGRFDRQADLPDSWMQLIKRIVDETYNLERTIQDLESKFPVSEHPLESEEITGDEL